MSLLFIGGLLLFVLALIFGMGPVIVVALAPALIPWAKRIVSSGMRTRRELTRIVAQTQESFQDLVEEVKAEEAEATPARGVKSVVAMRPDRAHKSQEPPSRTADSAM